MSSHDIPTGAERIARAFPDGAVVLDAQADVRFVLDAASRNLGVIYTPPLAIEPQKVVLQFVHLKELASQVSLAEAQTAIALYERAGRPVPPGLHTKLAAAQLMAREVMAERAGAERFPVQLDDEAVRLFEQHMQKQAPAAQGGPIPGFDL